MQTATEPNSPVYKLRRAGRLVGTLRLDDPQEGERMGYPAAVVEYRPAHAKEGVRRTVRLMPGDERDPARIVARGVVALGLGNVTRLARDHFTLRRYLSPVERKADRAAAATRRVVAATAPLGATPARRSAPHRSIEPDRSPAGAVREVCSTADLARATVDSTAGLSRRNALSLLDLIEMAVNRARRAITTSPEPGAPPEERPSEPGVIIPELDPSEPEPETEPDDEPEGDPEPELNQGGVEL